MIYLLHLRTFGAVAASLGLWCTIADMALKSTVAKGETIMNATNLMQSDLTRGRSGLC
jgi:hypothetical protein